MANITNPTEDEISFLRKLYDCGGELTLQGGIGPLKVERLFPEYVAAQNICGVDAAAALRYVKNTGVLWVGR